MFKLVRSYNWLIFNVINKNIENKLSKYASGKMIDIGCGDKPYLEMASCYVSEHIGLDHEETMHDKTNADLIGTAYKIPENDGSFDTILCTDVLEHLEEPSLALDESYRILKNGGYAIYTMPLYWHLHEEPRDYYRFTKYGLKYLFEKSGFKIIEIKALTGFSVTFIQELVYFLQIFRKGGKLNPLWWLIPIFGHLLQSIGYILNKIEKIEIYTCEYLVVVRKSQTKNDFNE